MLFFISRVSLNQKPRYLYSFSYSMSLSPHLNAISDLGFVVGLKWINLVFFSFIVILHLFDHSDKTFNMRWRSSSCEGISAISSAYSKKEIFISSKETPEPNFFISEARSLT